MNARTIPLLALAGALSLSGPARAELAVEDLLGVIQSRALAKPAPSSPLPAWLTLPGSTRIPLLVELPPGVDARTRGFVPIAPGFAVAYPEHAQVAGIVARNRDARLLWSPARRPLLEQAGRWARVDRFIARTGGTGRGAVIGIIDTGLDVRHPDLRQSDGRTRVRWLIDFSRGPLGLQPELELEYGCAAPPPATPPHHCAIYSGDDLDAVIGDPAAGPEPGDLTGHGTHVASLAAGNGLSQTPARYVGVAPEAPLIIARVTRDAGQGIWDPDIVLAARFIFDQAARLGLPAVANLSLGSDFGGHDGSAPVEQGLAALVGEAEPGRAIVVAAGNSGGLFTGIGKGYPEPFGVHTEVHVPHDSPTRVPILVPASSKDRLQGTVWVWISTRPSDRLRVGIVDRQDDWLLSPVGPGEQGGSRRDQVNFSVLNRAARDGIDAGRHGTVVIIDGKVRSGSVFALRFEGQGTARIWISGGGELAPGETTGPLLPRATKAGTINIPASHEDLIAVGATLNRREWEIVSGGRMRIESHGSLEDPALDSLAYFSSAGPTAHGFMKPDIVAPGAYIVGAMARVADPRANGNVGLFECNEAGVPAGTPCMLTDPLHAVLSGTSMASPIVAGAVALLLERDPTLTQRQVLALLQAGSRRVQGTVLYEQQLGVGALDLDESWTARTAQDTPALGAPSGEQSWIALADDFMRPDPDWPLRGRLELRDGEGHVADGFEAEQLKLRVAPSGIRAELARVAPGSWSIELRGKEGSGGQTLSIDVELDGQRLVSRRIPIAVDRGASQGGASARGGCQVAPAVRARGGWASAWALLGTALLRRWRSPRPRSKLG